MLYFVSFESSDFIPFKYNTFSEILSTLRRFSTVTLQQKKKFSVIFEIKQNKVILMRSNQSKCTHLLHCIKSCNFYAMGGSSRFSEWVMTAKFRRIWWELFTVNPFLIVPTSIYLTYKNFSSLKPHFTQFKYQIFPEYDSNILHLQNTNENHIKLQRRDRQN